MKSYLHWPDIAYFAISGLAKLNVRANLGKGYFRIIKVACSLPGSKGKDDLSKDYSLFEEGFVYVLLVTKIYLSEEDEYFNGKMSDRS